MASRWPGLEALGVDLVDVLGARRPGGEPAVGRRHLQPADGGAVARGAVSFAVIGSPASSRRRHRLRRQVLQLRLLLAASPAASMRV